MAFLLIRVTTLIDFNLLGLGSWPYSIVAPFWNRVAALLNADDSWIRVATLIIESLFASGSIP